MKNYYSLIFCWCFPFFMAAQAPANDDCANIVHLGVAPACPPTVYSNLHATATNIGFSNQPSCSSNAASRDVWFQFSCPDDLLDFRVTVTATSSKPIINPQFTIYRGDCLFNGLAEMACADVKIGTAAISKDIIGLTPRADYFIRVWDDSPASQTSNAGNFLICVDKIPPVIKISEGGSNLPAGALSDSGGPDGNYSPSENFIFPICPNTGGLPTCITFTFDYYNLDFPNTPFWENGKDIIYLYDGANTSAPLIAQINGPGFDKKVVGGGGSVCSVFRASSGCLTVQFVSDGSKQHEGFLGRWVTTIGECPTPPPLVLSAAQESLIANALSTPFSSISNVAIHCADSAVASFTLPQDNALGMKKGLVLSSGYVQDILGPNQLPSTSGINFYPGDADLDYLSQLGNGETSEDACVVEMDVFVVTDELSFEYAFGSEEYPEFANQDYNDIFAFLVSGPGIAGDPNLSNSSKNIALLPGTNLPVEINTVNQTINWQYFRNNQIDPFLELDGFVVDRWGKKKSLTARTSVIPCQTYHLKLAIADRADDVYDSVVFISEIGGGTPDAFVEFASGADHFVEGCSSGQDVVKIRISNPIEKDLSLQVSLSGSAIQGVDYQLNIPPVVTIPAGKTELVFPITVVQDNQPEGTESILLTLSNNFGCGQVIYKTLSAEIKDDIELKVPSNLTVCSGIPTQLQASGAGSYFWQPVALFDNPFSAQPTLTTQQNVWVKVTGTLNTCTDVDSFLVRVNNLEIKVSALDSSKICLGKSVRLQATGTSGLPNLTWSPKTGLSNPNSPTPTATPTQTTTYTATINDGVCIASDSITIFVDTLFFPKLTPDTVVCQRYPIQLSEGFDGEVTTQFVWSPQQWLNDATLADAVANPNASVVYTLTATSANGYCSQTGKVSITVIPASVDILGDAYREICLGTTVTLDAVASPAGGSPITWTPPFSLNTNTGNKVIANTDETVTYTARYVVNGCVAYDSVTIRVDSLPAGNIFLQPIKQIYCPGDTVYLLSTTYEPASFPDLEIYWPQFGIFLTPDTFWNLVILASETHTYKRELTNRACSRIDSVKVPVGKIPEIVLTAEPPGYCPGGSSRLTAKVEPPSVKLEWEDHPALSCTNCFNPIANPSQTTTFTVKTVNEPCPANAAITVEVYPLPPFNTFDKVICLGESALLNNAPITNSSYTWTTVPPSSFTSSAVNPTVTPTQTTVYRAQAITDKGCTDSRTVTVTVARAAVNAGADQTICEGANVTLNATQTGFQGVITWVNTPNPANNPNTFVVTGNAEYIAVLTYGNNCIDTDTVRVTALPRPALKTANDTTLCSGRSLQLNNVQPSSSTYAWTTVPPSSFTSNSPNPVVTPTATTTYQVVATTNQNCSLTKTIRVDVADAKVNAGPDLTLCQGDRRTLNATQTGTPGTIFWIVNGQAAPNPYNFTAVASTALVARVDYGPGCSHLDTLRINVQATPRIDSLSQNIPAQLNELCEGAAIAFKVFTTPAVGLTYKWFEKRDNEDFKEMPTEASVTLTPKPVLKEGEETVTFQYKVVVSNAAGCTTEAISRPFIIKNCLAVPNAFTPNGDQKNDTFGLVQFEGVKYDVEEINIFSRWGEKVFSGGKNQSRWDGNINGKPAPSDVYVYIIQLRLGNGILKTLSGELTLLR